MTNPPRKSMVKINKFTQANLIRLMLRGMYTCRELAEQTGLHYVTVLDYTRELHRAKAAYICAWEPDLRGRYNVKVYKIGTAGDVAKPKLTGAQRSAAYREKRKAHAQATSWIGTPTCA